MKAGVFCWCSCRPSTGRWTVVMLRPWTRCRVRWTRPNTVLRVSSTASSPNSWPACSAVHCNGQPSTPPYRRQNGTKTVCYFVKLLSSAKSWSLFFTASPFHTCQFIVITWTIYHSITFHARLKTYLFHISFPLVSSGLPYKDILFWTCSSAPCLWFLVSLFPFSLARFWANVNTAHRIVLYR